MKVYIGADHRGYELKEKVKAWVTMEGHSQDDLGAYEHNPHDDYTLYAQKVGSMVAGNSNSKGILICGSGVGVDIAANKIDGVRASLGKSAPQVQAGRADDDMNVLVLASDFTKDEEAKSMVKVFLATPFLGQSRHKRRLADIRKLEASN